MVEWLLDSELMSVRFWPGLRTGLLAGPTFTVNKNSGSAPFPVVLKSFVFLCGVAPAAVVRQLPGLLLGYLICIYQMTGCY